MSSASEVVSATVPLTRCRPHPDNYNAHPVDQIDRLRVSLRKFGQVQSVVLQAPAKGKGDYIIVAGEGITTAARLEGIEEIEARIIPADWPQEKVKAYLAADNESARKSARDEVQLASLLQEVAAFDEELIQAVGLDDDEFDALLKEITGEGGGVKMRDVDVRPPPEMAWVLVGIPVVKYGRIADDIDRISEDPEVIVETTVTDKE